MLDLERKLSKIDAQRKSYHILLNRSKYREEVEKSIWMHAADLTGHLDFQSTPIQETDPILVKACKGAFEAFETVRTESTRVPLTVERICDWHEQLMKYSDPVIGGQFRRLRAHWLNSTMILANWAKIPDLMDNLVRGINEYRVPAYYWDEYPDKRFQCVAGNPVMQAIEANYNTIATHPFQDGNKRVSRLVSAWILKRARHIPLSVFDRDDYITGIETYYNTRRPHALYEFLLDQMERSYDMAMREVRIVDTIRSLGTAPSANQAYAKSRKTPTR